MAKQAKVFNGTSSLTVNNVQVPVYNCCDYYGNQYIWYYTNQWVYPGNSTLYTVPSGRTAKVEVAWYSYARNIGSGGVNLNTPAWPTGATGTSSSISWSQSVTSGGNVLYLTNGYYVPKVFYLSAGQSLVHTGPSVQQAGTNTLEYNFSIVEEY